VQSLQEIVGAAQRGDAGAFSILYDHYFDRVYRYVMSRVRESHEAEDLTQEIFLKVFRGLSSFRFHGPPFGAWLFRIARNTVVDWARTRDRLGDVTDLEAVRNITSGSDLEAKTATVLDIEELYRALTEVTDLQREVVRLRFIVGLNLAETASSMQRSENAVKALQYSALRALRRYFDKVNREDEDGDERSVE